MTRQHAAAGLPCWCTGTHDPGPDLLNAAVLGVSLWVWALLLVVPLFLAAIAAYLLLWRIRRA